MQQRCARKWWQFRNIQEEAGEHVFQIENWPDRLRLLGTELRACLQRITASGLDALELALRANGIGPGDEVITAANTFIATVLAVLAAGARPVLAEST
jgi:non-ribosomal peptide synthetase component E (peptide arylation enzyme)